MPERALISWYRGETPNSGERWQMRVRLNTPRGFVNPGGFDYHGWLLRQGIHASGYVRADEANRMLASAGAGVDVWRQQLRRWILGRAEPAHQDLLLALLIGDRSEINADRWRYLQATGTNHLEIGRASCRAREYS